MMEKEQFWRTSYDPGLTDLDPKEWEISYVAAVKDVFTKFPDNIALAYMGTHITFAGLDRYANRFGHMLLSHGFAKGDVVGINMPNIPEYVIAWLGTLRAGCVVSGVSPLLSGEEMAYQLRDSHARGLVTLDAIYANRITAIADELPDLKVVAAASIGGFLPPVKRVLGKLLKKFPTGTVESLTGKTVYRMEEIIKGKRFPSMELAVDLTPDDIAYLQYTGGTTGTPKGVMLSHRNTVAEISIVMRWLGWEPGSGTGLSGFPFFHMAGMLFNECSVYLGHTQVLIPNPRDTDHICKELRTYQPQMMANVPSLYQALMENPKFRTLDFSTLETCMSGAAPFPEEAQRRFEQIVGQGKLLEVYGLTETSPIITMNPYGRKKQLGSIGLPVMNTDIRLCDPVTGAEVAAGEPGEICVKGPQVMVGYFNHPEETSRVIDADGYLHTGDVAVQDADGYLRIVDRTKDMIIVGGFKVFSTRVEDILVRHPAVSMAALIGIPNPERPGSEFVKAYITLTPAHQDRMDIEALKQEILDYAREKLSSYEVPKIIEIRTELPMTAVGKVDKKVLRQVSRGQAWVGEERRAEKREKVDLPCAVEGVSRGEELRENARVIDLCRQGMFVEADEPLDEGTHVHAAIDTLQSGTTSRINGKVLRSTENGMAIRFREHAPKELARILDAGRNTRTR